MAFIPRIPLSSSSTADLPFDLQHTRFPSRLAFAMTINNGQGQALNYVGPWHRCSHIGQLYIALSRLTDSANQPLVVPDTEEAHMEGKT